APNAPWRREVVARAEPDPSAGSCVHPRRMRTNSLRSARHTGCGPSIAHVPISCGAHLRPMCWPVRDAGELVARAEALETAYNPNDCVEVRWGARAGSVES